MGEIDTNRHLSPPSMIPVRSRRLIQDNRSTARWLQILLDLAIVVAVLGLLTYEKVGSFTTPYRSLAMVTCLLMLVVYQANGVYTIMVSVVDKFVTLARAWSIVFALLILAGFATKSSEDYSRQVLLTWALLGYLGQCAMFLLVRSIQTRATSERIPSIIVGAGSLAKHLAEHINTNTWIPDQIVGVLDDDIGNCERWSMKNVPVLGNTDYLKQVIQRHGIRRVYIALPLGEADLIKPLYLSLANDNIDVIWAPDIFGINLLNHSIREVAGVPLITLSESPLVGSAKLVKSIMDYTLASLALIVAGPIMLLTALAIKLTSPGPILFRQERHGWDGKIFTVYKFRSMRVHKEEGTLTQATKDDDRVTPIGRFLRKSSIDELPQLFNVLNGTMSLVGPRPHAILHNEYYSDKINTYMMRHRVKPGLTGLAQVNGYRGETKSLESMAERVNYDLDYINNWSAWLDIKIMFRTVFVLFGGNAY